MKGYWLRYTDDMPRQFIGMQRFFMIKIRPQFKGNKAVLAHEVAHIGNWYKAIFATLLAMAPIIYVIPPLWPLLLLSVFTHEFLYKAVRAYRRYDEVIGHRAQVKAGDDRKALATALSSLYDLKMSYDEAWELIG